MGRSLCVFRHVFLDTFLAGEDEAGGKFGAKDQSNGGLDLPVRDGLFLGPPGNDPRFDGNLATDKDQYIVDHGNAPLLDLYVWVFLLQYFVGVAGKVLMIILLFFPDLWVWWFFVVFTHFPPHNENNKERLKRGRQK